MEIGRARCVRTGSGLLLSLLLAPLCAATGDIEEILVHAQKRESLLTDTPVSISVIGQNAIDDWALVSFEDLQLTVPNLKTFSQFAYNNAVSLRGVGTFSRNIGFDERVGIYLDGIYLGPSYGLNQSLLDVAQVEVLRGPQGTFFGRNSIAGAVTLVSAKPQAEPSAKAFFRAGNLGTVTTEGLVSVPLGDTLAASVSAGLHKRDGLTTNIFNGETLDNRDRNNVRLQFLFTPSDRFEAHLSLDRNELDERLLIGEPGSDTFGIFPDSAAPNPFEVDFNTPSTQKVVTKGAGLSLTWHFTNGMQLQSLTGIRSTDAAQVNDTDYVRADILRVEYAEDYHHWSEELRLESPDTSRLQYVFGVTYLDQRGETDRHAIGGTDGLAIGVAEGADMTSIGYVDTHAWGLYGNLDYMFSEKATLSLGLRYSHDDKEVDWMVDTSGAPFFFLATGTLEDRRHDTDFSPTASLTYKLSDKITAFARYGEGYKSGGYNLDYVSAAIFPDQLEFEKETARSYEAGIKGNLGRKDVWFSATFFWVDYKNFQVNQFLEFDGGSTAIVIANAAKVRTKGMELEWRANPMDGLHISGAFALLDAGYRQFTDGGVGGSDVSGNELDAPEVEASISIDYRRPVTDHLTGFVTTGFAIADGYYVTPDNVKEQILLGGDMVPFGYVSPRNQLNLKVGLEHTNGWRVAFWSKNAFNDKGTASSLRDFFGTIVEAQIIPRTYGIELAYNF